MGVLLGAGVLCGALLLQLDARRRGWSAADAWETRYLALVVSGYVGGTLILGVGLVRLVGG